jgi:dipeptidyl-peptidase-4
VSLDGGDARRLTPGDGSHVVSWNADGSLYVDTWSSLADPGGGRLYRRDGTKVRELYDLEPPDGGGFLFSQPELVSIPARDGYALDAMIVKPVPFDPSKAHPVFIDSYFGPDSPSVRNRWNGSTWDQFLAQQGMVVMSLNVRSASGRGHAHTTTAYKQLGVVELRDLCDAVDWLTAKPWADAERVGVSGYSYGGFMAAYALLNSDKFRLGFAGGGVYDWRNYDTMYTERYMRTPQNNPEGYDATSCIKTARGLRGHLVIHHGTIDENVHMQNAIQLVHALQEAGRGEPGSSFELMLYPGNRHGNRGPAALHNRRLLWASIQRHLLN